MGKEKKMITEDDAQEDIMITTGKIFKKFWSDELWWSRHWVDDAELKVDGKTVTGDFFRIADESKVTIIFGIVRDGSTSDQTLQEYFIEWNTEYEAQFIPPATLAMNHIFTVTIPRENAAIFLQMVKNVGGTVS